MISYYFPPIGGAGVQRMLYFAKYLPQFKYEPIILTPDNRFQRYHSYDYTLLREIEDLKIYKDIFA